MAEAVKLTEEQIRAIEKALSSDERAEVHKTKDGIRVFALRRKQVTA